MKYKRLRELRLESGLTQTQVGEILGINQRTYSCYELGTHNLSAEILLTLADYYDVSIDYLLGRTNKRNLKK